MANKELNRLKVVLAEKRKRTNGLVNNWERIKQPYQNGVLILVSQIFVFQVLVCGVSEVAECHSEVAVQLGR